MTGDDVREVFAAILPQEEIDRLCMDGEVMARPRTLPRGMLVRALVIAAGTPGGASQADSLRSSLEWEVPQVARSAVYRGFDAPRERFLAALAERALAYARAQPVDRSGPLGGVQDWSSVEATTVRVHAALPGECPGPGAYAALNGHQVLSVGCGAPVCDHCSPAREPASRPLTIDDAWRGGGLLADLA